MDDEPGIPAAAGGYAQPHTQAWSRKVSEGDAIVFVTPQYNWGYPAPLKNALDFLYAEWKDKSCRDRHLRLARRATAAPASLRQVVQGLNMRPVETMPGLKVPRALIEANDGSIEPDRDFAEDLPTVRQAFLEFAGDSLLNSPLTNATTDGDS